MEFRSQLGDLLQIVRAPSTSSKIQAQTLNIQSKLDSDRKCPITAGPKAFLIRLGAASKEIDLGSQAHDSTEGYKTANHVLNINIPRFQVVFLDFCFPVL